MLRAQFLLIAAALAIGGCATSARNDTAQEAQAQKALGERIQRICGLPEAQRAAEIDRLKSESGFVLYCGK
jgi:hypothetical protein